MSDELFEYLAVRDIGKKRQTQRGFKTITEKWDLDDAVQFLADIIDCIPYKTSPSNSTFNFICSDTLSGAPYPCAALECRFSQVVSIAQFAALYSNEVLIPDPFEILFQSGDADEEHLVSEIVFYVSVLFYLRPLIEEGLVKFAQSQHYRLCPDCYYELVDHRDSEFRARIKNIRNDLIKRFSKEVEYNVTSSDICLSVKHSGPEELVEHGVMYLEVFERSPMYDERSRFVGENLKQKQIEGLGLADRQVDPIISDILRQDYYSKNFGTNYLTQRDVDFWTINKITNLKEPERSRGISDGMSHKVPTLPYADPGGLVKLRKAEQEAFAVYQHSLSSVLASSKNSTAGQIQEAFADLVAPEVSRIENFTKNYKKTLRKKLGRDVLLGSAFIGISLFSGLLPPNIGKIISALGGFHFSKDLYDNISGLMTGPDEIKNDKFYFLWKALRKSSH